MRRGLILLFIIVFSIFFPFNISTSSVPGDDFFFDGDSVKSLIVVGETATSSDIISASKLAFLIANRHTERIENTIYEEYKVSLKNLNASNIIRIDPANTSVNSVKVAEGLKSLWWDDGYKYPSFLYPYGDGDKVFDYNETHEEIILKLSDIEVPDDYCVDFNHSDIIYRVTYIHTPFKRKVYAGCGGPLYDIPYNSYKIRLFEKEYPIIYNGKYKTTDHNIGYFVYGIPIYYPETIFKVGDSKVFGWYTVTLLDIHSPTTEETSKEDKYKVKSGGNFSGEYKVYLRVSDFTGKSSDFLMVMDANSSRCCSCVPLCDPNGGYGAFTTVPTRQYENDPFFIFQRGTRVIDGLEETIWAIPVFYIDGIKVFEGADKSLLAEFDVYSLKDYGAIEETSCCMPFVTYPNDYNLSISNLWQDMIALGVDIDLNGNVSGFESQIPVYETPGEECNASIKFPFISPVYINPGKDGKYGTCDDFLDINASHRRFKLCNYDTIDVSLCDKIDLTCCDPQVVYGPKNYFKIDILDSNFKQKDEDGVELEVSQKKSKLYLYFDATIKIEPTSIIKRDTELTGEDRVKKNLILIGNENNNLIIKELLDLEISKVSWSRSFGQWEYIQNVFYGNSVLIVGGKDGSTTNKALEDLMSLLFV
ncbi:MAG: hypothetical protein GYA60_03925 [Candidatus Methanofastidiosa archaeon]|nr:hypothetical protein [Candidatus Methanofastidiosa archaeon]